MKRSNISAIEKYLMLTLSNDVSRWLSLFIKKNSSIESEEFTLSNLAERTEQAEQKFLNEGKNEL